MNDKEKREQLVMRYSTEPEPHPNDVIPSCGPNFRDHRWDSPDLDFSESGIEWVVGVSTCWKCGMKATEVWRMTPGSPKMTDPYEGVRHPLPDDGPIEIEEVTA